MKITEKIVNRVIQALGVLAQDPSHHDPKKTVTPGMPELLRHAAAQGAVLLENSVLPFEGLVLHRLRLRRRCERPL